MLWVREEDIENKKNTEFLGDFAPLFEVYLAKLETCPETRLEHVLGKKHKKFQHGLRCFLLGWV